MERHDEFIALAKKSLKSADHLAYMTYPLVKDLKIILLITENIYSAVMNGMEAILHYDRYYKRINLLPENFESRFETFKQKCAPRYNLDTDDIMLIEDIRNVLKHHKSSNMEFIRNDKLIICSPSFKMKTFDINSIKQYLVRTKKFISKVDIALQ